MGLRGFIATCAAVVTAASCAGCSGSGSPAASGVTSHVVRGTTVASTATGASPSSTSGSASTGTESAFTARPLVSPQQVNAYPSGGGDPFAALAASDPSLRMPDTEQAYAQLSDTAHDEIAAALQRVNCADVPTLAGTRAVVVCDSAGTYAALAGAPIFTAAGVLSAVAQPPDSAAGTTQWSVKLTLKSSAADAWHAWTARYNTTDPTATSLQTGTSPPCGLTAATPCSDFVAMVVDGRAVSIPVTRAVLSNLTNISGNFDRASATALATQLAGAPATVTVRFSYTSPDGWHYTGQLPYTSATVHVTKDISASPPGQARLVTRIVGRGSGAESSYPDDNAGRPNGPALVLTAGGIAVADTADVPEFTENTASTVGPCLGDNREPIGQMIVCNVSAKYGTDGSSGDLPESQVDAVLAHAGQQYWILNFAAGDGYDPINTFGLRALTCDTYLTRSGAVKHRPDYDLPTCGQLTITVS